MAYEPNWFLFIIVFSYFIGKSKFPLETNVKHNIYSTLKSEK